MNKEKEFQINKWKSWDINEKGFFISKADESGTIWVGCEELGDLKELIRRTELEVVKQ